MKFDAFLCLNWQSSTEQLFLAIYQILTAFVVILGGFTGAPPLFELGTKQYLIYMAINAMQSTAYQKTPRPQVKFIST